MANTTLAMPRTLLDRYMREAAAAVAKHNEELGERIRQARKQRQLLQKQLAAKVSVEPMTVSRWERGVNQPDMDTLRVIAQATQKPLAFFVEEREVLASAEERLSGLETQLGVVTRLVETILQEVRRLHDDPPDESTQPQTEDTRLGAEAS